MGQHILLSDVAPGAARPRSARAGCCPLGLGAPRAASRRPRRYRAGRAIALATSPWIALPLWARATTWIWAIPAVFDYSAAHSGIHALEHATLFYTGLAMWWLIVDPLPSARQSPNGRRLAYLGFTRLASAVVCLPLVFMTSTAFPRYVAAPRAYGLGAIGDQQLAGAGMCFVEFLIFGIAMVAVFISFLARDERQRAPLEDRIGGHVPASG